MSPRVFAFVAVGCASRSRLVRRLRTSRFSPNRAYFTAKQTSTERSRCKGFRENKYQVCGYHEAYVMPADQRGQRKRFGYTGQADELAQVTIKMIESPTGE